jgi:hypothetical protein
MTMPLLFAIVGAVLLVIVVVVGFIATRPESFRIERSAPISASPEVVFSLINDFHHWGRWSPWEKLDPAMKKTFEGAAAGPGAIYAWAGNSKVGEGRMTLLESKPGELVTIKLEFFKPFKATNQATFQLRPTAAGSQVHWIMDGKKNFMMKAFTIFMDMDKMVGKDFEEGLANLNTAAQAETQGRGLAAPKP